ncbi:hypothetical protein, partial [Streptomyces cinereoruber]|uniref:hypothetical protein n=1 Tax=Streptomyces cinereoruber TaxID=67260 RepID=UPI00363323DF
MAHEPRNEDGSLLSLGVWVIETTAACENPSAVGQHRAYGAGGLRQYVRVFAERAEHPVRFSQRRSLPGVVEDEGGFDDGADPTGAERD